jgi:hypothetical protein
VSREQRALAAFLVLAAVATVPAFAFRSSQHARPTAAHAAQGSPTTRAPSAEGKHARIVAVHMAAGHAMAAELAARRAASRGDPAQICTSVPRYPTAVRVEQHPDQRLLGALGALGTIPSVPPVTKMERFSLGRSTWLGGGDLATVFGFYSTRMRPIGFAAMSESVRREIGVRPTGTVDSPPLLYVNRTGAALVQGSDSGVVRLTLFCGPVEL